MAEGQAASSSVRLKQLLEAFAPRTATCSGSDAGSDEELPLFSAATHRQRRQRKSPAADQEPGALATKRSARPTVSKALSAATDQESGALATKRSARPTVSKEPSPAAERKLRFERTPHAAEVQKDSAARAAVAGSGADLGCKLEAALARLTAEIGRLREEQHASKAGNSHAGCELEV